MSDCGPGCTHSSHAAPPAPGSSLPAVAALLASASMGARRRSPRAERNRAERERSKRRELPAAAYLSGGDDLLLAKLFRMCGQLPGVVQKDGGWVVYARPGFELARDRVRRRAMKAAVKAAARLGMVDPGPQS